MPTPRFLSRPGATRGPGLEGKRATHRLVIRGSGPADRPLEHPTDACFLVARSLAGTVRCDQYTTESAAFDRHVEKTGLAKKIWLNFESEPLPHALVGAKCKQAEASLPVLHIHSSSLSPGLNPYADAQVEKIFNNIEHTFKLLITLDEFEPATITDIAHYLETLT